MGDALPARLLLVIHHLVVDGVSWRILLEDLVRGYRQLEAGEEPRFPAKTTSFRKWAERLAGHAHSVELAAERGYWRAVTAGGGSALPVDLPGGTNTRASARTLAVSLDEEETRALLQEVPAAYRTQINDVLLTALAAAFSAWTGERSLLVELEGHGREEDLFPGVDLSRTVGWFTAAFPVRLPLASPDIPGDSLKRVKEALRAVPHKGIGYGLLRYMTGDDELAAAAAPQVSFNYLGQLDQALPESSLFARAAESAGPSIGTGARRTVLFEVGASVLGGRLRVQLGYSAELHHEATVEALAAGYLAALRRLIEHCRSAEAGGLTPSDVPLLGLDQEDLDRLFPEPRAIEDAYPLSPLQEGMLLWALGAPDSGVYVEQMSLTLDGDLDAGRLESACREIVARHPILRTAFLWEGVARPVQVVRRRADLPLLRLSLAGLPPEEQGARLDEILREDRRRGFDLSRAPLLRATVVELSPGAHRFVWTMHHLIGDGWSAPVLMREMLTLYEGALSGAAVALEPARPFRDYIEWVAAQDLAATEAFWRRELAGFTSPTPLGADRPLARRETGFGDERIRLSRQATAALEAMARGRQLTLGTLIQGAWALLLSRYSAEQDVLFGITVSGRPADLRGAETMVGPFISTVPLRVAVPRGAALVDWLRDLQQHSLERQAHEYGSFVQPWSEVPMGLPLFETLLVFENYPRTPAAEAARRTAPAEPGGAAPIAARDLHSLVRTRYALNVVVNPGAELQLYFSWDASRLDQAVVRRMQEHLRNLLEGFAARPAATLGELPLLSQEEMRRLLAAGNGEEAARSALVREIDVRRLARGLEVLPATVAAGGETPAVHLLGEDLLPVPAGLPGEVHLGVARTAGDLPAAPWDPAVALLPAGIWGRRAESGEITFLGTLAERLLIHGRPVWPGEVEAALERHPAVGEAVVVPADGGGALAALFIPATSEIPSGTALRTFLENLLPRLMVPRSFLPLADTARSAGGRVDRTALGGLPAALEDDGRHLPPRMSQMEELLLGLYREVLGIESLRPDDSFLDLGGNSLIAARLVSRLRAVLGVEVPLRTLFEAPSAAELACRIEGEAGPGGAFAAPALTPVSRDRELPLSFAQQRLWFLAQLAPGDVSYNVNAPVRVAGALDAAALARAFAEVVRRHESLRTSFPDHEGRPAQRIAPPSAAPFPLPVFDLRGLTAAERETEVRRLVAADARTPFDLVNGPLLRAALLLLAAEESVLLFSTHHIVSDAWSMSVLVREVAVLYEAFAAGRPSPLPELPIQYADFAHWQRSWLAGEALDAHLDYWTRHLGGEPPALDLPADRPRPERPSGRGWQRRFLLPAELSRAVVHLGRQEGATTFMTMLAAFAALLGRLSGQSEVVVGMPMAGRDRYETEGLIGFFINILPLRLDLSRSPTFRELLRQAREASLGAFAHQELPLEKLVEALGIERRQDRSPLFQVTFGLQNAPEADVELPELRLSPLAVEDETVRFDLTVWVRETRAGLGVQWTFNTDLFEAATIERMQARFEALLAAAVGSPETEIDLLDVLSAAEREESERAEREKEQSRLGRLINRKPRRPRDGHAES